MKFLDDVLWGTEEYRTLERAVEKGATPVMATGLSGIHKAHLIYSMCRRLGRRALVIAADETEASRICTDINEMGIKAVYYPARDFTFREYTGVSGEFIHQRIGALCSFIGGECDVVVTCADAALQYTVPPEILKKNIAVVREGEELSLDKLVRILLACGYVRAEQVEGSGQFSVRGGILDVFMPSAVQPYRVEFWGDEIDTISEFDTITQRRTKRDFPLLRQVKYYMMIRRRLQTK